MPTYVYKFTETGETIEVQQAFTDDALTEAVHPATGQRLAVKKVFQPVGVTFKGGGFYKTDSRGGKAAPKPSTGTGESGNGESGTREAGARESGSGESGNGDSGTRESGGGESGSGASTGTSTTGQTAAPAPAAAAPAVASPAAAG
jgi:predicted nucleic acid-binding Zn ribbon protein